MRCVPSCAWVGHARLPREIKAAGGPGSKQRSTRSVNACDRRGWIPLQLKSHRVQCGEPAESVFVNHSAYMCAQPVSLCRLHLLSPNPASARGACQKHAMLHALYGPHLHGRAAAILVHDLCVAFAIHRRMCPASHHSKNDARSDGNQRRTVPTMRAGQHQPSTLRSAAQESPCCSAKGTVK